MTTLLQKILLATLALSTIQIQQPPVEMASYHVGFFRRVADRAELPQDRVAAIQTGHLKHLSEMAADGLLLAAGPFGDDGDLRGILIFRGDVPPSEIESEALNDPMIENKLLRLEFHAWRGPAGIGRRISEALKTTDKPKYTMRSYQLGLARKGPAAATGEVLGSKLLAEHRDHVFTLMLSNRLPLAGPFTDDGELQKMYLFQTESLEEARQLASEDPLVRDGFFQLDIRPLWLAEESMPENK